MPTRITSSMSAEDRAFFRGLERTMTSFSEEPYKEYWSELGAFMHAFSNTETQLIGLLRHVSGVKPIVAGLLFSGTRQDQARDMINKILDATNRVAKKKRLEYCFAQLATISTIRNNIIHWGAIPQLNNELLISNALLFPTDNRLKEFIITPTDLRNMKLDLIRISSMIMLETGTRKPSGPFVQWLSEPWFYRPPQPSPPKKETRPPHSKHPPQKRASRKSRPNRQTPGP